jgi:hypothetical protein
MSPFLKKIQTNENFCSNDKIRTVGSNNVIGIDSQKQEKDFSKQDIVIEANSNIEEDFPVEETTIIQPESVDVDKKLTSEEKLLIQLSEEKQKTCTISLEKLSIILQSRKLMIQNYDLRTKQTEHEMKFILEQIKQNQEISKELKEDHLKLTEVVSNKYMLKKGWRFNPETGEIT